jgi:hypothetical protein
MFKRSGRRTLVFTAVTLAAVGFAAVTYANHSWGGYHWARTGNPFVLQVGDNLSSTWDTYLATARTDWNKSTVLDIAIVAGGTGGARRCPATTGRVEACNDTYGNNGWLGIASISISGKHITAATAKYNDTYFNTAKYNTPAWRRLVMCQEIAHTFGLDHQDETFGNYNLGTCMDYTNAPAGGVVNGFNYGPSNEHPNQHDYDQLVNIYNHSDTTTTVRMSAAQRAAMDNGEWGRLVRSENGGRTSTFENDLGNGRKIITFVIWADPEDAERHENQEEHQ